MPFLNDGRLRAIAVTGSKPFFQLPGVPTVMEQVPGYTVTSWLGVAGPAGMPPAFVSKVNAEIKALLADPTVPRVVDRDAVDHYLRYLYVPSPSSIFEGIHKLPPASLLVWDGGDPVIERYWEPDYTPKTARPLEEDIAEGAQLLRDAVRLRLRSDVPLGAFLSGGMDSSVVTALMAEAMDRPVQTYSIGFDNQAFDELPYARAVAEHLGTDHHEERLAFDPVALLPELADHYDEPFGDSSSVPTFRVAQVAARWGDDIPVVNVRCLSDLAGAESHLDFRAFLPVAARYASLVAHRLAPVI